MPGDTLVQERRGWADRQLSIRMGRPVGPDLGSGHLFNWHKFTSYLRKVWGDNQMYSSALRELGEIYQRGSVDKYVGRFRALAVTAEAQPERTLLTFFQRGLNTKLHHCLAHMDNARLSSYISAAIREDRKLMAAKLDHEDEQRQLQEEDDLDANEEEFREELLPLSGLGLGLQGGSQ
ncbi:Retrotransposon gag domain [Ceraceosorus bombacis]|uniref:Retrotransposon gag domain n=1 Tax=Ceraceosorus bombacis TaxID=401625 RepID=A0A0N7LBF2_9BASI|nr:Retrotransposon gag domain [Ceraceosorus bombacis]